MIQLFTVRSYNSIHCGTAKVCGPSPSLKILGAAPKLLIELLWQGIPIRESMKLTPVNFDSKNRIVFIPSGRAYRLVVLSHEFWANFENLRQEEGRWFWSFLGKHHKLKMFKGHLRYIRHWDKEA